MRYFLVLLCCAYCCGAYAQTILPQSALPELRRLVDDNPVFGEAHTGFCLYDLNAGTYLYGHNANRYFVPASNVKLLTFYLANRVLHHRAPGVFFQEFPDRIELWGAGYPLTLHPGFTGYDELTAWLSTTTLPLVLNLPPDEAVPRYGAGWSWDDYDYGYVFERSTFPVYGNRLFLDLAPPDGTGRQSLFGSPPSIAGALVQRPDQKRAISRSEADNSFTIGPTFFNPRRFPLERSLRMTPDLTVSSLATVLSARRISLGSRPRPAHGELSYYEVSVPDTVYRKLLQDSDNFLAEQLVIQSAARRYGAPDEATIFDYATDTLFAQLGIGEIKMTDGSGLSRYNLAKPNQLARVIMALDREIGRERLLSLLTAGGVNGTLKNRFNDKPETYVWAKTGSLSGVVCLSGLLKTRSGRWLAFSFMHNNTMARSSSYYRGMERTLGWVYDTL